MKLSLLFVPVIFALHSVTCKAQQETKSEGQNIMISGIVYDQDSIPISYALIQALSKTGTQIGKASSDTQGHYTLQFSSDLVEKDLVDLSFSAHNFKIKEILDVPLKPINTNVDVILQLSYHHVDCEGNPIPLESVLNHALTPR